MSLHDQIMNMRIADHNEPGGLLPAYRRGYKQARHDAAELALASDAEIERLRAVLRAIVALDDDGVLVLVADQMESYDTDFVLAFSNAREVLK